MLPDQGPDLLEAVAGEDPHEQMKTFLDHYCGMWLVHKPNGAMFGKQGVVIASAAGPVYRAALREMKDSLDFWGVARTYKLGFALMEISWDRLSPALKQKIARQAERTAAGLAGIQDEYLHNNLPLFLCRPAAASYQNQTSFPWPFLPQPSVSGQMKTFLDHYCGMWMVHKPNGAMFGKQGLVTAIRGPATTFRPENPSIRISAPAGYHKTASLPSAPAH